MLPLVIIGAGPAGAVAAVLLRRAGIPVVLIEQNTFPRDKVCGECLSSLGIEVLGRAGLDDRIKQLAPAILRRTLLHAAENSTACLNLDAPMWGITRAAMDTTLLEAARDSDVRILQPVRVEKIVPGQRPTLILRDLTDNSVTETQASCILLADGKAGLMESRPPRTRDLGIKAHFEKIDAEADAIQLFGVEGAYVGLAPVENGRWNVACNVPASLARLHAGNLDALFDQWIGESPSLARRFRRAGRASPWLASPLPRFAVQAQWPVGVIPLGNAAAALEPIGGEGMGLAMRSAELACAEIIAATRENRPVRIETIRQRFAQLWRVRRLACRATAMLMSSPRFSPSVVASINASPGLAKVVMGWMGKTHRADRLDTFGAGGTGAGSPRSSRS